MHAMTDWHLSAYFIHRNWAQLY